MKVNWSKRILKVFANDIYAANQAFPLWFYIANKRYRSKYMRWYGL